MPRFNPGDYKLLFVLKGYPRVSETFITQEIHLLEELGYDITILSMRRARETKLQPINEKVKADVVYMPEYILESPLEFLKYNVLCFIRYPLSYIPFLVKAIVKSLIQKDYSPIKRYLQACWSIAKMKLWKKEYQYLHSHFAHTPTELTHYISQIVGLPFSISAHAKDIYTIPESDLIQRVQAAEFITTCTHFNYEFLKSLDHSIEDKVFENYHGIDTSTFPATGGDVLMDPLRLVSIGRLVEKKGYPVIFKALKNLKDQNIDFIYDIFGAGDLEKNLKSIVNEYGLDAKIKFHFTATHPEIISHIQKYPGIFLCGSVITGSGDRDGIPNTVAEAMSLEIPVIATKVSGIPEIIEDGVDGFLIPSNDSEAMTKKILELLEDPKKAQDVALQGRQKVIAMFESKSLIHSLSGLLSKSIEKSVSRKSYY